MGDISKHLSRWEMECNCGCGFSACDKELIDVLEDCVSHFETKQNRRLVVDITGPNRCITYNAITPGEMKGSTHPLGLAMDFRIRAVHEDDIADYLEAKYPNKYGIGRYNSRIHLDVLPGKPRRWDKRNQS